VIRFHDQENPCHPHEGYPRDAGEGLILDVREHGELERKGRVHDALHVPRGLLKAQADHDGPMASERLTAARDGSAVVDVLCASGAWAALAAAVLNRINYRTGAIEDGMEGWEKVGLPIDTGTGWSKAHPGQDARDESSVKVATLKAVQMSKPATAHPRRPPSVPEGSAAACVGSEASRVA
jgi:rhodanese-related sulfurtransferase